MKHPSISVKLIAIFGIILGNYISPLNAGQWSFLNSTSVEGKVTEFDFETKTVTIENPDTLEVLTFNTADLDFPSKRRLLFSRIFHTSFGWSMEKIWLFGLAILSPVLLLIVGMWLSALFIAKKFNPFSAIGAFIGSWVSGILLLICYFIFGEKAGGSMAGFMWVGGVLATGVMALFISAIYKTKFLKGLFIFIAHLIFAGLVGYLLIFSAEKLFPADQVAGFWEDWVFSKVGLVAGAPDGY